MFDQELMLWVKDYVQQHPGSYGSDIAQTFTGSGEIPPWEYLQKAEQVLNDLETRGELQSKRSANRFAKQYYDTNFKFERDAELLKLVYHYIQEQQSVLYNNLVQHFALKVENSLVLDAALLELKNLQLIGSKGMMDSITFYRRSEESISS